MKFYLTQQLIRLLVIVLVNLYWDKEWIGFSGPYYKYSRSPPKKRQIKSSQAKDRWHHPLRISCFLFLQIWIRGMGNRLERQAVLWDIKKSMCAWNTYAFIMILVCWMSALVVVRSLSIENYAGITFYIIDQLGVITAQLILTATLMWSWWMGEGYCADTCRKDYRFKSSVARIGIIGIK